MMNNDLLLIFEVVRFFPFACKAALPRSASINPINGGTWGWEGSVLAVEIISYRHTRTESNNIRLEHTAPIDADQIRSL